MGASSIFQARINSVFQREGNHAALFTFNTLDTTTTHARIFWPASKILHSQVVLAHSSSTVRAAIEMRYDTKTLKIRSIAYSFRVIFQKVLCDNITPSSVLWRLGRLSKDMRCCWPGLGE
jgi:hypothetical protein